MGWAWIVPYQVLKEFEIFFSQIQGRFEYCLFSSIFVFLIRREVKTKREKLRNTTNSSRLIDAHHILLQQVPETPRRLFHILSSPLQNSIASFARCSAAWFPSLRI